MSEVGWTSEKQAQFERIKAETAPAKNGKAVSIVPAVEPAGIEQAKARKADGLATVEAGGKTAVVRDSGRPRQRELDDAVRRAWEAVTQRLDPRPYLEGTALAGDPKEWAFMHEMLATHWILMLGDKVRIARWVSPPGKKEVLQLFLKNGDLNRSTQHSR